MKMLKQDGYGPKTVIEGGKYIYSGCTQEQKENLASLFFENIETVFKDLHRDYAQAVFDVLSPSFLGRSLDLTALKEILERVGDSNPHFRNMVKTEITRLGIIIE